MWVIPSIRSLSPAIRRSPTGFSRARAWDLSASGRIRTLFRGSSNATPRGRVSYDGRRAGPKGSRQEEDGAVRSRAPVRLRRSDPELVLVARGECRSAPAHGVHPVEGGIMPAPMGEIGSRVALADSVIGGMYLTQGGWEQT